MAYTALQLITAAYNLSGVVTQDGYQQMTGAQSSYGLGFLNDFLAEKSADIKMIPYFEEYDFTAVVGQEQYFVPNLVSVETMTFNIGPVRYSMSGIGRDKYFGTGRVDNVQSLPFNWHFERTYGGANIYIYFLPNDTFPLKIWGKFQLSQVTSLEQDLSLVYDNFYLLYLRYGVAELIANANFVSLPPGTAKKLLEIESQVVDVSPPDLEMRKISSFTNKSPLNWGDINTGQGWRPTGA